MKKIALLSTLLMVSACMGHDPHPVPMHEAGDEQKSCAALMTEMTMIEGRVSKLAGQDKGKNTSNAIWGITGAFLYVPLVMLDLSDSEKIEMQAYEDRYRTLAVIAVNKGCDPKRPPETPASAPVTIPFAPASSVPAAAPASTPAPSSAASAPTYTLAPAPIPSPAVQSRPALPPITDMPPPETPLPVITEMPSTGQPNAPSQAPAQYLPDSRYKR